MRRRKFKSEQQTNYAKCSKPHGGIGKQDASFLQGKLNLCRDCRRVDVSHPMDGLVALEVTNKRITRLHRMQNAPGLRLFKERPQVRKMVAAAARIETGKHEAGLHGVLQAPPVCEGH